MAGEDRVRWDKIYRSRTDYPNPDPLLLQYTPPVEKAQGDEAPRALDLAAGLGQNGIWLAEQGYITDIMDISRVALQRARAEMTSRNLRNVNLLQTDVDFLELDDEVYEVICVFRYLRRDLFPQIKAAIVPGGRIIYETFNLRYLEVKSGFNRDFLLDVGELAGHFDGWQVVFSEDADHISRLVAIKPD